MKVAIIDYGAGNIKSIQFALERLGCDSVLSDNADEIENADKVIFPGVGEANSAMRKLKTKGLDKVIPNLNRPVLGICLGMQLLCNSSEEGNTKGLGVFDCEVFKFSDAMKVPQIGWNQIFNLKSDLFSGVSEDSYVYLVHSFYASLNDHAISTTNYGLDYASALQKDNFYGVQFHPEKSSTVGQQILSNFLKL
tara:strand:- start:167510 stop:168091 length:582 start_codon:yes stop_codon:yes gene_type:complete